MKRTIPRILALLLSGLIAASTTTLAQTFQPQTRLAASLPGGYLGTQHCSRPLWSRLCADPRFPADLQEMPKLDQLFGSFQ